MVGPAEDLYWRAIMLSTCASLGPTILTPSVRSLPGLPRLRALSATLVNGRESDHLGASRLTIPVAPNLLDTDHGIAAQQISELACVSRNAG